VDLSPIKGLADEESIEPDENLQNKIGYICIDNRNA
jgi:hypothetical protein